MERVDTLTFKTYFAQVTASAFGAIILIYVVLVVRTKSFRISIAFKAFL